MYDGWPWVAFGSEVMIGVYEGLRSLCAGDAWLDELCRRADAALRGHPHGDLPRWRAALRELPDVAQGADLDRPAPALGAEAADRGALERALMALHPWRKGPLRLGGVDIDSEWRSDLKWARLAPHVDLAGRRVLDIGCGNGYYGWRMLAARAALVVGIDPTVLFVMQWLACRHFSGGLPNFVLPLAVEDLPEGAPGFDTVFTMGVLYHRRDPRQHLERVRELLRPGGDMVLETLVLPGESGDGLLVPQGRYARMRNVWAIPGTGRLQRWVGRAGFSRCRLVDVAPTGVAEQRSTPWMQFESLEKALDPQDGSRTIEGHPAPVRVIVVARR